MSDKTREPRKSGGETGPLVQDKGDHFRDVSPKRAGGQGSGAPRNDTLEPDAIDRDAMGQADYGGTREPEPEGDAQQGGLSVDDASGGGREPTVERDSDYDPDGARTGR